MLMCCLLNKAKLMTGTPHVSDTSAHRLIKHMKMMFIGDTPKSEFFYFCHGMPLCLVQFCLIYFQFDPCVVVSGNILIGDSWRLDYEEIIVPLLSTLMFS